MPCCNLDGLRMQVAMPCMHSRPPRQQQRSGSRQAFSTTLTRSRRCFSAIRERSRVPACRAQILEQAVQRRTLLGLGPLLSLACSSEALAADPEGTVRLVDPSEAQRLSAYQRQVLEFNQRVQRQNNCPPGFPSIIRDKFDLTVVADGFETTPEGKWRQFLLCAQMSLPQLHHKLINTTFADTYSELVFSHVICFHRSSSSNKHPPPSAGLIYKDFKVGGGKQPVDGEQVTFAYTAYNESGGLIDSTYRQGRDAQTQLGIGGMIPGARP